MSDQNDLSISIRARILPVIEGSAELKAEIGNLPTSISSRMQETIQSPAFQHGLTPQQISKVQHLSGMEDVYEFQKIQEKEKFLISDYQLALESGKLAKAQITSYNKKFTQLGNDYAAFGTEFIPSQLDEEYYKDIDPARKEMLRASARQGAKEVTGKIPGITEKLEQINYANDYTRMIGRQEKERGQIFRDLEFDSEEGGYSKARGKRYLNTFNKQQKEIEEFQQSLQEKFQDKDFITPMISASTLEMEKLRDITKDFSEEIEKAGKVSGNLLQNLKATGLLTMAGVAVDAGMNYMLQGKRIEAAERTSFDFGSPMGMYSAEQQFELYKRNTERTRQAELTGGIGGAAIAGVGALALGATGIGIPAAVIGGYFAGSSLLGKFAEGENIDDTGKTNEQLKRRQQVYEQLNGMVSGSSQYDILRARTRARIGEDSIGSLGLGYTPEEELQMRSSFADKRGRFDKRLYGEQTTFARAEGIDPSAIYDLNLSARMTGQDVGISGMDKARQIATATYGENVSSQRIVDVLNDLKNINERMLDVNMNMDTREAANIGLLPSLIFGKDSPYGQMGNRANQGLSAIERLGAGGSNAEDAWLYNAYGRGDLNKFYERKREGIYRLENFNAITSQLNRDFGGNESMIERRLNTMPQFAGFRTAGIIPKLAQSIVEHPYGYTPEDFEKFKNDPDFKEKNIGDYKKDAAGAISDTEKNRAAQQTIMNQIGDDYRKMINRMSLDWLATWRDLSTPTNNRIILENQLNDVLGESVKRFKEFFLDGGRKSKEFEEWMKEEEDTRQKVLGKESDSDRSTKKFLQRLDEKFRLEHSDSYNGTSINDAHGAEATGWVREKMLKLQEELSESALGERYRVNLLEGEAKTGHAPGSLHYQNLAADVQVYDKFAHEKISKGNYPGEVKDFFHQFADREKISYGGDWKRPDENHFQYNKEKDNPQQHVDYDRLAQTLEKVMIKHETKIIVEDRTSGGIKTHDMGPVSRNANSFYNGR